MKKFLLIDDDEIFNFLNKKVLELSKMADTVTVFTSGQKALDHLAPLMSSKEEWPKYVLLDIRMPGMDGFEFLQKFKDMDPNFLEQVKVYMLTSSIDERDKYKSGSYPFVRGFFSKPLNVEMLRKMVLEES